MAYAFPLEWFRPLLVLVPTAFLLIAAPLRGQTYAEIGDAGQTVGTAQGTGLGGTSLTTITGTISSATDADLFAIRLTAPATFSATTVGGLTTLDTALFLFNSAGVPIYTNDDASGSSLQSTLPGSTSFTASLAAGTYFLGISLSGNEPINLNAQLLFAAFPGGDSTAVRGPASGINPNTLFNFNGQTAFAETGAYQINLTSTATAVVPEPTTAVFCLFGAVAAGFFARRQRQSRR